MGSIRALSLARRAALGALLLLTTTAGDCPSAACNGFSACPQADAPIAVDVALDSPDAGGPVDITVNGSPCTMPQGCSTTLPVSGFIDLTAATDDPATCFVGWSVTSQPDGRSPLSSADAQFRLEHAALENGKDTPSEVRVDEGWRSCDAGVDGG